LVVINWNYGAYVGATIASIKSQDYPAIEVLVVDNGSTDDSREVIASHVGDDPRFRILHLGQNLGQLGAYFDVFKLIRGEFVTIVDADDVLFPSFVSSHVQVHLAVQGSVALTSSNVVEITAAGRVLTGGYAKHGFRAKSASRGLRPLDASLRLSTISESEYRWLAQETSSVAPEVGPWIWGPGTANMFRRSILALVQQEPKDRTYFRAADSYLNPLCHVLGGTALIDRQLSAYRIHDANYFAARESVNRLRKERPEFRLHAHQEYRALLHFLFDRAVTLQPFLGSRFWSVFRQFVQRASDRDPFSANGQHLALFIEHYRSLSKISGESRLFAELRRVLGREELRTVVHAAHHGRVPRRIRVALLKERVRFIKGAARRVLRKAEKTAARALPPALLETIRVAPATRPITQKRDEKPKPERDPADVGPVAVLSVEPPIFLTGMAFNSMLGIAPAFGRAYGRRPAAFLIYPCWSVEGAHRAGKVIGAARAHQAEHPEHELLFICNTGAERDLLARSGLDAHLLNKNLTVSDTVFRPLPDAQVEFDAIYNARFDPRKRHELAAAIERVAYVGYLDPLMGSPEEQSELAAGLLRRNRGHALLNPIERGLPVTLPPEGVNAALNRAAVGLCLSSIEGSNYASIEYMLAGLPVVSTPSVGGREIYFDHEFCIICDPEPAAVRDAVEALKSRKIPRDHVRARTLAKIEPARRRFLSFMDDLSERLGGQRHHDDGVWPFGAISPFVTWRNYGDHLQTFAEGRDVLGRIRQSGLDAEIKRLMAGTEGIQMEPSELRAIVQAIRSRPGCSLLVFGCGNDSTFWERAHPDGPTAFVEDDAAWADKIRPRLETAEIHLVDHGTRLTEWVSLLNSPQALELDLPQAIRDRKWDVIVVDGPAGHDNHAQHAGHEAPGRMKAIYMASKLVAPGGCVFVHDCERLAERNYAARYLGADRLFLSIKGHALLQGYAF
jgi:glycosyltransferase involved in cell wall biosynthesis